MHYENEVMPNPERLQEFLGESEDGPFVMVNLLKFRDQAEYPDGADADLSGLEAYMRYGAGIGVCLDAVGARPLFTGPVTGLLLGQVEELWDMVALAEYPSLNAFKTMMTSPEYQEISIHRTAGLAGQLNIKTKPIS
ncbi:DUF1330 domain-containing protein [Parasphingopyxis algicola]|uniref:DUF1330 domain-containing protein n=1 Tax=Parasphingopyxis algicola TaxID=2026624 RepID=UPI00159FAB57|nr:DUF1330 domain-containing protein [Parasphingopyxis algicola]QLC24939.1 DUF1330 domain-containing protein [Parasphingopyxis algicola]